MDGWRGLSTHTCTHTSVVYRLASLMLARAASSRHVPPLISGCDVLIAPAAVATIPPGGHTLRGSCGERGWCGLV
jgi:hypothetical protein